MKQRILLSAILFFSFSFNNTFAAIIYDNGVNSVDTGFASSNSNPYYYAYDNFIFNTDQTITDIHWRGMFSYEGDNYLNFTINIYKESLTSPIPGDLVYSYNTSAIAFDTGLDYIYMFGLINYDIIEFRSFVSPFVALAEETYWIEIRNDYESGDWYWAAGEGGDMAQYNVYDEPTWYTPDYSLSFQLTNDGAVVPEPSSLLLLGTGLMALAAWRRKRD